MGLAQRRWTVAIAVLRAGHWPQEADIEVYGQNHSKALSVTAPDCFVSYLELACFRKLADKDVGAPRERSAFLYEPLTPDLQPLIPGYQHSRFELELLRARLRTDEASSSLF